MNHSWPQTIRRNSWVYSPSELLITLLFLVFFMLSLGACFSEKPGSETSLFIVSLYGLIWLAWLYFSAVRQPPPFGALGLLQGLVPWLGLILCYSLMKSLVPVLHPQMSDALLHQLNLSLMGRGPSLWEQTLKGHPFLTDLFCFFYLAMFAWLIGLLFYHSCLRRALYQRFMLGLIVVYIGGFLGFLFFPAIGPRFAYPQDWAWMQGGLLFQATQYLVVHLGAQIDVFPSLHGALSTYLLLWQLSHDRRGLVWGAPLALGIWLSTLFLGFHYFPDLLSGLLLAGLAAWLGPHLERFAGAWRRSQHPPLVWLLNLTEGYGDYYGKLAGRLIGLLPLGSVTSPGLLIGATPRNKAEKPLRKALCDLGNGPFLGEAFGRFRLQAKHVDVPETLVVGKSRPPGLRFPIQTVFYYSKSPESLGHGSLPVLSAAGLETYRRGNPHDVASRRAGIEFTPDSE